MEPPTVAPFDLHREYFRTLFATKVAATVFIAFAALWCYHQHVAQAGAMQIFENMVSGGMDSMPKFTKLVMGNSGTILMFAAFLMLIGLVFIWPLGYTMARVIYAGTLAIAALLLTGITYTIAFTEPLHTVITKFNG